MQYTGANRRSRWGPICYGHNFSSRPSLGHVLKESATLVRPPFLRKYTYRLTAGQRLAVPYFLTKDYLSETIDPSFPVLSRFLHVDKINDVDQYNRLCTLAYFFERYPYEPGSVEH